LIKFHAREEQRADSLRMARAHQPGDEQMAIISSPSTPSGVATIKLRLLSADAPRHQKAANNALGEGLGRPCRRKIPLF
jgi:hypothetical protein